LSTQPNTVPSWKQEVNQRIAAHKNRKGSASATDTQETVQNGGSSRAAEAAARVAARYAKAPSYSELQAAETRVAVRAAEIATKVALKAQAVAETAVAEMHAAVVEQPSRGPAVVETFAAPVRRQAEPLQDLHFEPQQLPVEAKSQPAIKAAAAPALQPEGQSFGIRWEPDLPKRSAERKSAPTRRQEEFELAVEDWWTPGEMSATLRSEPIEIVEPESTHANLIEFPRELVATRKIRPRLDGFAYGAAAETEGQLSIFEVDPGAVSNEIASAEVMLETDAPLWNGDSGAEWSGMELDAQPAREWSPTSRTAEAKGLLLAPLGLRLMALVVDGALIIGLFSLAAFVTAAKMAQPPVGKPAEMMAVVGLALTLLLYHALFFRLAVSTPGMKYAGIGLCTFAGKSPTRVQLRKRLGAMFLSLLPMGLGIVWAVFDEDHLSWHDRISQTYLRKL
jgi:uncharacterized RDD family membrane protein YckC